jgi:hypothetical protein
VFYLDKFNETYDKNALLIMLTKLKRYTDFVVLNESAVTLYCGYPTDKIDIKLMSDWKKPVESMRKLNVEGSLLKLDNTKITVKLVEIADFTVVNGIKVQSIPSLFSSIDDTPRLARVIQENHLSRQYVTNIKNDHDKDKFVVAFESIYGVQNKDVWNRLLKEKQ